MFRLILLLGIVLSGCTPEQPASVGEPGWIISAELQDALDDEKVAGVVVVYDPQKNTYYTNSRERADTEYLPASTYKIFNSLVALETGVVADEEEMIEWDDVVRFLDTWNQDQNLRSAIKYSAVWFYQDLARRIGEERMQQYIDAADYGNGDISGGIDQFWLNGGTRITPNQQVGLLVRLRNSDLTFSERTMSIVRDIMILDESYSASGFVLRGKTGWADSPVPGVGWFVGYIEKGEEVYYLATEIDMLGDEGIPKRRTVTDRALENLGIVQKAIAD